MTEWSAEMPADAHTPVSEASRYQGVWLWADLDGTLLNPERQLDAENLAALGQFHGQGGRFGVATGRSEHSLALNFPELTLSLPGIFYNGALVQWHPEGAVVRTSLLSTEPVPELEALRARCPDVGIEVLCGGRAFLAHRSDALEAQMRREGLAGMDAALSEIPAGWFKVLLGGSPDSLSRAAAFLEPRLEGRFTLVRSESSLLEILEPGVSKGNAIAQVQRMHAATGGERPFLVAVGDNDNDADMLAMADLGIAMGDGSALARAAADAVIGTNRVACLPQVLFLLDGVLRERRRG